MERIHHHRIKMENAFILADSIELLKEEDDEGNDPNAVRIHPSSRDFFMYISIQQKWV